MGVKGGGRDGDTAGADLISYRRSDTPHVAGRLFDRLVARFGAGKVFIDVDTIEPGLDFTDAIADAVGACDVLLALIGSHWLDAADDRGRRRLDDPDDLVVVEIATALQRQIRVIPVLVDGAAPPRRDDLPKLLASLARRQTVRLDHATFSAGVGVLLAAVERAVTTSSAPGSSSAPPTSPKLDQQSGGGVGPERLSWRDWTVHDFKLLISDRRPSSQRIVKVLDILAEQPEVEISLSDLANRTGLSRNELRGAFSGFTRVCKLLRSDVQFDWPIMGRDAPSGRPDQDNETRYCAPATVAERWKNARDR
jgi:hypothetical protein